MRSRLWTWDWSQWVGFGRIKGGLLPGVRLGFGTVSWCPGHWEDGVSDALIKRAEKKKGEKR